MPTVEDVWGTTGTYPVFHCIPNRELISILIIKSLLDTFLILDTEITTRIYRNCKYVQKTVIKICVVKNFITVSCKVRIYSVNYYFTFRSQIED